MHEISKALFRFLVATIRLPSHGMNLGKITTLAGSNGASLTLLVFWVLEKGRALLCWIRFDTMCYGF